MKQLIILAILLSALSSEAQNRLFGNGFFNIRNNKFGWFGTSGTDTVGYVDSLKVKWFKPVMPGFYTTSTAPTASSFTGSIIYNTDSSLHQYSNGSAWVNLPGTGGGGGGGGVTSFTDGSGFDGTVTGSALSLTTSLTTGSLTWIGASGALSQNNANLFWDNSNVRLGIGTATPAQRLHILQSTDALALMQFTNANTGVSAGGGIKLTSDGGDSYMYRTSIAYVSGLGDDLVFQEAGGGDMVWFTANEKMRLLNNGNFGIGINNPGRVLDLFHGSQAQIRLSAVAGSSYSEIFGTGGNFYLSGSSTTNTLVAIGGSTSAFPGVRRNATILEAVLADGSALTDMNIAGRAYNATTWNGSNRAVSEDAIRDKVETLASQSALNDTAAAIRALITEQTVTTSTTSGGSSVVIDIAITENTSGEVELIIVGVGGTTLGSFHDRRFVMFQNETGSAPTIDATSFTMNSASPVRLNGMDASAAVGYTVSSENLRLTFTASTTEDVSWKVYYKIRSHTFPL